jgi:Ni/Co efflux regulator RcnB
MKGLIFMKKFQNIMRMALVLVVTVATFSGAALTAQAAEPRPYNQQWEHQDNDRHRDNHNDKKDKNHKKYKNDKNYKKDWKEKENPKKDVDQANRKANIAIGVAAIATIVALSK